jgi:hypothetical protein
MDPDYFDTLTAMFVEGRGRPGSPRDAQVRAVAEFTLGVLTAPGLGQKHRDVAVRRLFEVLRPSADEVAPSTAAAPLLGGDEDLELTEEQVADMDASFAVTLESARAAFWAEVVNAYPYIEGGDFSPEGTVAWQAATGLALSEWLGWNHPNEKAREHLFAKRREFQETEISTESDTAISPALQLLRESQDSIGGTWRERRDEVLRQAGLLN